MSDKDDRNNNTEKDLGPNLAWRKDRNGKRVLELSKAWPDGTRFRRWMPTKKVAEQVLARIVAAIAVGTWPQLKEELTNPKKAEDPADVTVAEFAKIYYERWCLTNHKRPEFQKKELKNIVRIVGDKSLRSFSRDDANYFRKERAKEVGPATVRHGLSTLSGMFRYALIEKPDNRDWVVAHPMFRFKWGKVPRKKRIPLDATEVQRIVEEALKIDDGIGRYLGILSETALRCDELMKMKRQFVDVHPDHPQIIVEPSKDDEEGRQVPLSAWAIELYKGLPPIFGSEYLFARQKRRRVFARNTMISVLDQARKNAGIAWKVRPHDFRHFRALEWLANRANIHDVKTWMGHKDIKTTEIYLKYRDEQALERFRAAEQNELRKRQGAG